MRFSIGALAVLALFTVAQPALRAHEEFRIIGAVTRITEHEIDVKQKDSRTVTIRMNKETLVTRDKKKVPAGELKKARSVVVDALGDDLTDLLALEVRIVPEIKSK
jgi:hypothetical protein